MENQSKYSKLLLVICVCIIFLLISCNSKNSTDSYFSTDQYKQELEEFPHFLVDFFPDSISNIYSIEKNIDVTNECIYYINFEFESTPTETELILNKYQRKIKKHLAADDSTIIAIKRLSLRDKSEKIIFPFLNGDELYPIPYFESANLSYIDIKNEDIYSDKTKSGLSDNFNIYVLDSKPGIYWDGLKPLNYMPEGWKNGYSKGFCINEKIGVIIYWLIIW